MKIEFRRLWSLENVVTYLNGPVIGGKIVDVTKPCVLNTISSAAASDAPLARYTKSYLVPALSLGNTSATVRAD